MKYKAFLLEELTNAIFSGGTPSKSIKEYWNGDINWLSSGETRNNFIYQTDNKITSLGVEKSSTRKAQKGNVVIASAGQGKTRGQVSFLKIDTFINQSIIAIEVNNNLLDEKYLFYNLKSRYRELRSISDSASVRGSLTTKMFKDLKIDIPSLKYQKKISKILYTLDSKIEVNNKIIDNLEQQAQAIFKSWFIDFEPFQDGEFVDSEIGSIPKGWRVSTLDKIADYKNGLAMQKFPPTDNNSSLPVLKIRELNLNATNESSDRCDINIDSDVIVNDGDVIFSWSGTLLVKIWTGDVAGLNQHLFKVTSKKYDKWFYYLWTKFHLNKFISIAKDKATTMGHIKRSHLNESKVYICDDLSYKNIHNIISPIIEQRINLGIQNRKLAATRDLLLPKLLSGELDVSDFDI